MLRGLPSAGDAGSIPGLAELQRSVPEANSPDRTVSQNNFSAIMIAQHLEDGGFEGIYSRSKCSSGHE